MAQASHAPPPLRLQLRAPKLRHASAPDPPGYTRTCLVTEAAMPIVCLRAQAFTWPPTILLYLSSDMPEKHAGAARIVCTRRFLGATVLAPNALLYVTITVGRDPKSRNQQFVPNALTFGSPRPCRIPRFYHGPWIDPVRSFTASLCRNRAGQPEQSWPLSFRAGANETMFRTGSQAATRVYPTLLRTMHLRENSRHGVQVVHIANIRLKPCSTRQRHTPRVRDLFQMSAQVGV